MENQGSRKCSAEFRKVILSWTRKIILGFSKLLDIHHKLYQSVAKRISQLRGSSGRQNVDKYLSYFMFANLKKRSVSH